MEERGGRGPGVVEVFVDVELVLLELTVEGPVEVDPAHSVGLVESAPEVSEREVDVMHDAEVGVQRGELDAGFIAVAARENDVTTDKKRGLQLQFPGLSSADDNVRAVIFIEG